MNDDNVIGGLLLAVLASLCVSFLLGSRWGYEDWTSGSKTICEELVKKIENEWLPAERFEDGEDYNIGWNDCIQHLKENLK